MVENAFREVVNDRPCFVGRTHDASVMLNHCVHTNIPNRLPSGECRVWSEVVYYLRHDLCKVLFHFFWILVNNSLPKGCLQPFGKIVRLRNPQVAAYGGGDGANNVVRDAFVHRAKLLADNRADILLVFSQLLVTVEQSRDVGNDIFHVFKIFSEL